MSYTGFICLSIYFYKKKERNQIRIRNVSRLTWLLQTTNLFCLLVCLFVYRPVADCNFLHSSSPTVKNAQFEILKI